jgi:hypothetical protein
MADSGAATGIILSSLIIGKLKLAVKIIKAIFTAAVIICFSIYSSCSSEVTEFSLSEENIQIFPDYTGVTIPPNIAPMNFIIRGNSDRYFIKICGKEGYSISIRSKSGKADIPMGKWKKMLACSAGSDLTIHIYGKKDGKWTKYPSFKNHVATDSIDSYLVYRLIDPGYELWNRMGIYQRSLENFWSFPIMINNISDDNCMNCHSFCRNSSEIMSFHMRAANSGTIVYSKGQLKKVNTKTSKTISAGVYPSWHPSGKLIAFSVNNIVQTFHSVKPPIVEVTDTLSDIIIYDVERNTIFTDPLISSKNLETFPSWSPDGKYLYYCCASYQPFSHYRDIRYDLLRISFDEKTSRFGNIDTVVRASTAGKSVSFPRVSPDGRYLMFCQAEFGNFTIWHPESDLVIKDLETSMISFPDINSPESESYHSWSSNSRWVVFSSRRDDGLFTRLYISHFDRKGKAHKPFMLPLKDPGFYGKFLKSYNVPEFVNGITDLNPRKLLKAVYSDPVNAEFNGSANFQKPNDH